MKVEAYLEGRSPDGSSKLQGRGEAGGTRVVAPAVRSVVPVTGRGPGPGAADVHQIRPPRQPHAGQLEADGDGLRSDGHEPRDGARLPENQERREADGRLL